MNNIEKTSVRHLQAGDVLAGSGFTVTRRPYSQVRIQKGKLVVEGYYPGDTPEVHVWNASTTVSIVVR